MNTSVTKVTVEFLPTNGPPSVSPPLTFDTYDSFLMACREAFDACLGGRGRRTREWRLIAVTAQESLMPVSAVRRRKGYSMLYLDDEIRNVESLTLENSATSPRAGQECLYVVSSGPQSTYTTLLRLGMCTASSFVVCSAPQTTTEAVRSAIGTSIVITERASDQVSWDHARLFASIPGVQCVAGLVGLPIGPLRARLCADDAIGYRLQTMICQGRDSPGGSRQP